MTQMIQHTAEVIPLARVSWCCVQLVHVHVLFSIEQFVNIVSWSCVQIAISDAGFKVVAEQIFWLSVKGLVQQIYERRKGFIVLERAPL